MLASSLRTAMRVALKESLVEDISGKIAGLYMVAQMLSIFFTRDYIKKGLVSRVVYYIIFVMFYRIYSYL